MQITNSTLGDDIRNGNRVTAICHNEQCRHSVDLDLPALAKVLGEGFVTVGDPNPLVAKLACGRCGSKNIGLILQPADVPSLSASYRSEAYR